MGSQRDANGPGAIFCNEIRNHLSLYSNKNSPGTKTFFQLQLTPLTFFWVGKTRKGHFEGGEEEEGEYIISTRKITFPLRALAELG